MNKKKQANFTSSSFARRGREWVKAIQQADSENNPKLGRALMCPMVPCTSQEVWGKGQAQKEETVVTETTVETLPSTPCAHTVSFPMESH